MVHTKPGWAEAFKRRRESLGLSQEEVALRADVSPSLVAKIEQGRHDLRNVKLRNLYGLLRALDWTPEEFAQATGLELPGVGEREAGETYRGRPVIPGGLVMVPVVGAANGGKPMEYAIPVQKELVRPNTLAFEVHGDSMDDGSETAIKDGDWVLVDTSLTDPIPGRVYLVELEGDGYTIKRLRKIGEQYWLVSDNPAGESIPLDRVARIVGQVYRKVSYQEVR